jgi:hypothetical protein
MGRLPCAQAVDNVQRAAPKPAIDQQPQDERVATSQMFRVQGASTYAVILLQPP